MNHRIFSAPDQDRFGFARRFLTCTDQELVLAYNREVGKENGKSDREDYLFHLHKEMVGRELDCSAVMNGRTLSMQQRVVLVDNKLVVS